MKILRTSLFALAAFVLTALSGPAALGQQYWTNNDPPSNLPANTPASYNLIVPVVGQQESNWCWAACGQMVDEYLNPLPPTVQCQMANAAFGRTDCCVNPSSSACNVGDGGSNAQYPYTYFQASPFPLTWDQLRYQIWVVNKPVTFGWNYTNCCNHIMIVTGYSTDAQGNNWVYVNNPEPGPTVGDFECMSYNEWVQDTSPSSPFQAHTHIGDWFDSSYPGNLLVYNLATNATVPVNSLTLGQAPNLAGTVISDRVVPFQTNGPAVVSGTIQERVVQETTTQTIDFYYRIANSPSSQGVITSLTIQDFGRATVAAAYRPDSLGTLPATSASRDLSGSTIQIYVQPIAPGNSSHFIVLMTDATASADQGTMIVNAVNPQTWFSAQAPQSGSAQVATDQPTALPMTTANMSACPALTQPEPLAISTDESKQGATPRGLPRRLEREELESARKATADALPPALRNAIVGSPIQLASVPFSQLASYRAEQTPDSIIQPSAGLIVPLSVGSASHLAVFLKPTGSRFVPVGMGEPNMTSLIVGSMEAIAKQHQVSMQTLTVLKIPALFLTFIARASGGKILLTPVSNAPTYDLKAGEEEDAEVVFTRLRGAVQHYHPSGLGKGAPPS